MNYIYIGSPVLKMVKVVLSLNGITSSLVETCTEQIAINILVLENTAFVI